jgi:glycosyltransferase involved in cell wall biosynthesis
LLRIKIHSCQEESEGKGLIMDLPKVSILIPTYNQEGFIDKAIRSALNQDYDNLEIIVADDFSSDSSFQIIQKYNDSKVKYFRNEKNSGRVANYKKALYEYATGEWALCLDGDDYLVDRTYVSTCVEVIRKYELEERNVVFVQAGDMLININENTEVTRLPKIPTNTFFISGLEYFFGFTNYAHFSHLATFYNRNKAMEVGFYNDDVLSADMESILKLSLHGDVILLKKVVGVWLHHDSNASNTKNIKDHLDNLRWLDNCRIYGTALHPDLWLKFNIWYQRHLVFYLNSVMILLRRSGKKGSDLLNDSKILLYFCFKNSRFALSNMKFIAHFLFLLLVGVKKLII